jgi:AraC family transcriptional regulator
MKWLDRMNKAMDYIERNLAEEISYAKLAQITCCSTYHFQRMFSFLTGIPLSEYIRRRRLTLAAFDLQTSNIKAVDVAIKYGYESPEAFSRAFKNLHGVMPMAAHDIGVSLKAFPKITFSISIKGATEMNYRIEQKETFEVFGLELKTTVINGQCFKDIPEFWLKCVQDGRFQELLQAAGKKSGELVDVGVTYAHNPNGNLSYMLGCIKRDRAVPPGYTVLSIPKQTWAIFQTEWKSESDDEKLHEVWRRIYSEWFPVASYEHADCDYDLEVYYGDEQTGYSVEIWIPVIRK